MDGIYTWIRNIAGYFLFITILEQLMPGKQYGKYIRFFAGMVLILLVVQPLTGNLRIEEQIAQDYGALLFQYDAGDLKQEILGVEKERLKQLVGQYEEAVAMDVRQMAEDAGVAVESCQVTICSDQDAEEFGTVSSVRLQAVKSQDSLPTVKNQDGAVTESGSGDGNSREKTVRIQPVAPIKPVSLGEYNSGQETGSGRQSEPGREPEPGQQTEADREAAVVGVAETAAVAGLRKKIAAYYDLEESYVEIQMVQGER